MRDRLCQAVRLRILSIAVLAVLADGAAAQAPTPAASAPASASSAPGIELRNSTSLQPPPRGDAAKQLPIILQAREMRGRPDLDAEAIGDVEFRRGAVVIRSDRLTYDQAEDLARATGNVVISREGNVFFGPELQLRVERFEGFFRSPTYRFERTDAGGKATLIEFIDDQRAVAIDATYSSCSPDDPDPPWILQAGRIETDNETSTGIARDAVLRFYGVPILASPVLSFPLNDERRSGFLPPSLRPRQPQRLPGGDPLLLEHRAQSRRDLHLRREHEARPGGRRRVPLSPARLLRRGRAAPAAERPRLRQPFAPCVPLPPRGPPARATSTPRRGCCASPTTTTGRTSRAIAARRRRGCCSPTCSCTGRSATGRPTPGCSAGRCCRPRTRRPGSTRRPTSGCRRSARATPRPGAAASTSPSRASSTASPTRTTTTSRRARPATGSTPSAASAGRSTRPAGPSCPRSRSTPPRTRSTSPCPTAGAAPRA